MFHFASCFVPSGQMHAGYAGNNFTANNIATFSSLYANPAVKQTGSLGYDSTALQQMHNVSPATLQSMLAAAQAAAANGARSLSAAVASSAARNASSLSAVGTSNSSSTGSTSSTQSSSNFDVKAYTHALAASASGGNPTLASTMTTTLDRIGQFTGTHTQIAQLPQFAAVANNIAAVANRNASSTNMSNSMTLLSAYASSGAQGAPSNKL